VPERDATACGDAAAQGQAGFGFGFFGFGGRFGVLSPIGYLLDGV
jgi:hypothetical protein